MANKFSLLKTFLFLSFLGLFLSSCGSLKPDWSKTAEPDGKKRARQNVKEGKGMFSFSGKKNNREIRFTLPSGTTHYFLNLIDENNFLVSYPATPDYSELSKTKKQFSEHGIINK